MALFSKKTKVEAVETKPVKVAANKPAKSAKPVVAERTTTPNVAANMYSNNTVTIIRPRVTEKSGLLAQSNVYTFEVAKSASKGTIAKAVDTLYKVKPVKIAIINVPARKVFVKGRRGTVSGMKKAMVTLKKGDKIDFV